MKSLRPLLALALAACAANPPVVPGPDADPDPQLGRRIEVVGAASLSADAQSELELRFRLVDGTTNVADAVLDLSILGSSAGATLASASTVTDSEGIASVMVRTDGEATFEVEANAHDTEPARVTVMVRPMLHATLGVEILYGGSRALSHAEIGVFTNATCEDVVMAVPAPRAAARVDIGGRAEFTDLEMGIPIAVYAMGIDVGDRVGAETCSDVTLEGDHEMMVNLGDVAIRVNGPYATTETFDVTDGFSSGIDGVLDVFGVLGSSDPASILVDRVASSSSTPGWLRDALSIGLVRDAVATLFRNALDSIRLPDEVAAIGRLGADLDAAFTGMTFDGELHFSDPDEWGVSTGQHRLNQVRVPLADGTEGIRAVDVSADIVVTFSDRIDLDEHAFAFAFGEVVELVIQVAGLSGLSGSPATVGELAGSAIDCDAVAAYVGTGTTGDLAHAACTVGVGMLVDQVDDAFESLWSYDTLHLAGDAALADNDSDYDYETIETGVASARWVGESGQLDFTGTFEGHSINDEPGFHRVRERLTGLE